MLLGASSTNSNYCNSNIPSNIPSNHSHTMDLPIKLLCERQPRVTGPPNDHLGGQPGSPADEVDHQHQDQHLLTKKSKCILTQKGQGQKYPYEGKVFTLMILFLPLLMAVAAVQAWLLRYLAHTHKYGYSFGKAIRVKGQGTVLEILLCRQAKQRNHEPKH